MQAKCATRETVKLLCQQLQLPLQWDHMQEEVAPLFRPIGNCQQQAQALRGQV